MRTLKPYNVLDNKITFFLFDMLHICFGLSRFETNKIKFNIKKKLLTFIIY